MISCSIETEAKKAHKPGERSPCCAIRHGELHGCGLVALAYEIKTYKYLFCGVLAGYTKIYTNVNFPLYGSFDNFIATLLQYDLLIWQ